MISYVVIKNNLKLSILNLSNFSIFVTYQLEIPTYRHNLVDDGVITGFGDLLFEQEEKSTNK